MLRRRHSRTWGSGAISIWLCLARIWQRASPCRPSIQQVLAAQCLPRIRPGPWAVLQVSCVVRGRVRGETATLFSKVPVGALRRCLSAKLGDGQGCGSVKPQTDLQAQSPAQIYPPPSWAP